MVALIQGSIETLYVSTTKFRKPDILIHLLGLTRPLGTAYEGTNGQPVPQNWKNLFCLLICYLQESPSSYFVFLKDVCWAFSDFLRDNGKQFLAVELCNIHSSCYSLASSYYYLSREQIQIQIQNGCDNHYIIMTYYI